MNVNPWTEVDLADYEGHMDLDSVGQLQALDSMMADQSRNHPGGNGPRHADGPFDRVYGVDHLGR